LRDLSREMPFVELVKLVDENKNIIGLTIQVRNHIERRPILRKAVSLRAQLNG